MFKQLYSYINYKVQKKKKKSRLMTVNVFVCNAENITLKYLINEVSTFFLNLSTVYEMFEKCGDIESLK